MKRIFSILLLISVIFTPIFSDSLEDSLFGDTSADTSLDDMFGQSDDPFASSSEDPFIVQVQETEKSLDTLLLTQDESGLRIGGDFSFTAKPGFTWYPTTDDISATFSGSLDSSLFLDARMSEDTRFYTTLSISYPIVGNATNNADFSLKEIFADITYNDVLFFRVGKQTINWGVGYFFSPADLLNLSDIDPLNATGDVEGPVAIKMNAPIGIDNLYAYIILPPSLTDASDIAYAVKYEKVFSKTELGFGAYYRYDNPPAAMVTFSSGIGEIGLFGEAVLQYGSNKTFITGTSAPFGTITYDDKFFFLGTIGGNFTYSAPESDFSLSILAQYFYNGEGYANTDFYDGVPTLLFSESITIKDILNPGMHYVASNISFTFTKNLSVSVLLLGNMTDFSGIVQPSITYNGIKNFKVSLSSGITYGKDGTEFTQDFTSLSDSPWSISPGVSITFGVFDF